MGEVARSEGAGRRDGALRDWHAVELLAHVLRALVERRGMDPARVDALAWLADTGADAARVNVTGGAMALRHPLGASGATIVERLA